MIWVWSAIDQWFPQCPEPPRVNRSEVIKTSQHPGQVGNNVTGMSRDRTRVADWRVTKGVSSCGDRTYRVNATGDGATLIINLRIFDVYLLLEFCGLVSANIFSKFLQFLFQHVLLRVTIEIMSGVCSEGSRSRGITVNMRGHHVEQQGHICLMVQGQDRLV
ncbi:hypothetical protein BS17DRAFT_764407 [Gyrodon lividus]|nr:hypothetical protein BS17DRAFT_764407 [Gyrodon lividus]